MDCGIQEVTPARDVSISAAPRVIFVECGGCRMAVVFCCCHYYQYLWYVTDAVTFTAIQYRRVPNDTCKI